MTPHGLGEAYDSPLRRCAGKRINLFRAMHLPETYLDDDRTVLAVRDGDYALTVRVMYDVVFGYFYIGDCHWYRCDLTRANDDEVPEGVRQSVLQRFSALLG